MYNLNALFAAHTPQPDYLTSLCDHFYCSFLSVAELIPSPDHVVSTFSHAHEAYEFLIPLTRIPLIVQSKAVYFGEVGYVYPVHSGRERATKMESRDIANYNITVDKAYMEACMREKGLEGGEFNARFDATSVLKDYIRLLKLEFYKSAFMDKRDLDRPGALIVSAIVELGCRQQADRRKPALEYQTGMNAVMDYINRISARKSPSTCARK